ncbi:MAG: DUF308 domain-containing protein [Oscillospiraceae bacterium]|nr:DUF308 domain-containing protein [Oscillospiraceae bacterium]
MKLFKKANIAVIAASALTVVLGIILVLNPVDSTLFICRAAGILLLASGLFLTGSYFLNLSDNPEGSSLITGLIQLFFGAWISLRPENLVQFLTVIIGLIILIHSFGMFHFSIQLRSFGKKIGIGMLVIALVTFIFALVTIISPFGTVAATMIIAGIFLIIDGIICIIATVALSRFIKKVRENTVFIEIKDTDNEN